MRAARPLELPFPIPLTVMPAHPCSYLEGRVAQMRGFRCASVAGMVYQSLMDHGFRRAGDVFYQPICNACDLCVPIRIDATAFTRSKSQRRIWRRNADLNVNVGPPALTDEKLTLYSQYLAGRHQHTSMEATRDSLERFLYVSPVNTIEFEYRNPAGNLLGVGICDLCPSALSTVYFYFDPREKRRSLGAFSALFELDHARQLGIPFYYLGYWIAGCSNMEYKAALGSSQILSPTGDWIDKSQAP